MLLPTKSPKSTTRKELKKCEKNFWCEKLSRLFNFTGAELRLIVLQRIYPFVQTNGNATLAVISTAGKFVLNM